MGCLRLSGSMDDSAVGFYDHGHCKFSRLESKPVDDDSSKSKAAAWAWYGHGGGADCSTITKRSMGMQQRASRFRLEALETEKGGKFHILVESNRSNLLDAYEVQSFSRMLEEALKGEAATVHHQVAEKIPKFGRSNSLSRALGKTLGKNCRLAKLWEGAFGKLFHFPSLRGAKQKASGYWQHSNWCYDAEDKLDGG